MIKNPTIHQTVYYFNDLEICKGQITCKYQDSGYVEISHCHYRKPSEIYSTKQLAEKHLYKAYAQALEIHDKEISKLSKEREKLASKLAKLLKKR